MVTARFLVGTTSDAAILRVHEKIRANHRPHPGRHSRAADRRPRHRRRRDPRAHAFAEAGGRRPLDRQRPHALAGELRSELMKVDNIGLTYIVGGSAAADPGRARSREAVALTASRCSSSPPRSRAPTARSRPARSATPASSSQLVAGQTLRHPRRSALLLVTDARRPAGLCRATSPTSSSPPKASEHRVWNDARDGKGQWQRVPAVTLAIAKRAGANAVIVAEAIPHRLEGAARRADPRRRRRRRHPRLRRDRQREGERAALPPRPRHDLDHRPRRHRHRLARGAGARS